MTPPETRVRQLAALIGPADRYGAYFAAHSKSFSLAARLFPRAVATEVTAVYAFCRFTDDLVDARPGVPEQALQADLSAWRGLAEQAYGGSPVDVPLIDIPMRTAAERGVPFEYVGELVSGVAMDIGRFEYRSVEQLHLYTYRVAGVVGRWLTELFDRNDPAVLEAATSLGHAMQLTNILRDVGEDLTMGRLYLPHDLLARYGVSARWLGDAAAGLRVITPAYRDLVRHVMGLAEDHYHSASEAIPALPDYAQRAVVVAARVYRAIHREILRNGCDNLTKRAVVSTWTKRWRAAQALAHLPILRIRHGARWHSVSQ